LRRTEHKRDPRQIKKKPKGTPKTVVSKAGEKAKGTDHLNQGKGGETRSVRLGKDCKTGVKWDKRTGVVGKNLFMRSNPEQEVSKILENTGKNMRWGGRNKQGKKDQECVGVGPQKEGQEVNRNPPQGVTGRLEHQQCGPEVTKTQSRKNQKNIAKYKEMQKSLILKKKNTWGTEIHLKRGKKTHGHRSITKI